MPYPSKNATKEQRLRAYVYEHMVSDEAINIDGKLLVTNFDVIAKWLETGEVPGRLKVV